MGKGDEFTDKKVVSYADYTENYSEMMVADYNGYGNKE
jgi:hypothetical protein